MIAAFVSATTSSGTVISSGTNVVINLGALGVGSNHVVMLTASTSGSGLVTNTATVYSGEVELAPGDNIASSVVSIAPGIPFSLFGQPQGSGQFLITVSNAVIGRTYVVEGTTNFRTPVTNTVWVPIATNVAVGSTLSVLDSSVGGVRNRFYRAIER